MKYKNYIDRNINDVIKELKNKNYKIKHKYSFKSKDTVIDAYDENDCIILEVSKSKFIFLFIIILLILILLFTKFTFPFLDKPSNDNKVIDTGTKEEIKKDDKELINKIETPDPKTDDLDDNNNTINNNTSTNNNGTNNSTSNNKNNNNDNNNSSNNNNSNTDNNTKPEIKPVVNKYTVTFNNDGNKSTDKIEYNNEVTKPTDPIKNGYTFKGWYLNGIKFDFNTKITNDIELVAKYEINKYTVTFQSENEIVDTQNVEWSNKVIKPTDPNKANYTFVGWYLNDKEFDFNTPIGEDLILIAKYEIKKYDVKYDDTIKSYADSNNITKVDLGSTANIKFNGLKNGNIVLVINDTKLFAGDSYTYDNGEKSVFTIENGIAKITNVNDDISFEMREYVDVVLDNTGKIYNYANKANITSVEFVDYVDFTNATDSMDITLEQNGLAYAWVEGTKMYVGSELKLRTDSLKQAFYNMTSLESIEFNNRLDTSNVTDMFAMFCKCTSLKSLDVSNFNTKKVTSMSLMFSDMTSIKSLDVSNFDTSNVITMLAMFQNCSSLESIDVSNFNTKKVTDMSYMFYGMTSLKSLDVSNFDTSNVTTMKTMFQNCSSLESIDVSNFNTKKVTSMGYMFNDMTSLKSLDVSSFDTSNVTTMISMFRNCSNLESIDVSNFNTKKVTSMSFMFNGMTKLETIYANGSTFITSQVTASTDMFKDDNLLVGGNGTTYSTSYINKTYARIDKDGTKGYFTDINSLS